MNKNISVNITPDKSLIQKLGLVGYRTEQAIAELLDNSIDARISDKKEIINVRLDFEKKMIEIKDEGYGMDKKDLTNTMTIARGTKDEGKLGQFGIGMKSACSALGKKFVVVTSKINSDKEYSAEYDEKKWLSDKIQNWENFTIVEKTQSKKENWHGTRIIISELNVSMYPNQISKFKNNFGIRYFPYLNTEQISIQINTVLCKPEKPNIVKNSKKNIKIKLEFGKEINGYIALLQKRSIKGDYGFHLFKNGRLIKAYEKFGFTAHPENANIIGELNLDHVPINFNKSAFIEESPEYDKTVEAFKSSTEFKQIMQSIKSQSENIASVESVFDYFNKKLSVQYLERRVRAEDAQKILHNTRPFEIKLGDHLIKISVESLKNNPLYIINKDDSKIRVTINKDDKAFRFVKNPLFLIGIIASEIKLLEENPSFGKILEKRNQNLKEFLNSWSEKKSKKKEDLKDREIKIPHVSNYKLRDELIDVHEHLQENFNFQFQFTALSTLRPYLHNLYGKVIYTIYTKRGKGEYLLELLSEVFHKRFTILHAPNKETLCAFLKNPATEKIITIREYQIIKGSTIATPEKAFCDLINETRQHGEQIDEHELRRMFTAMKRSNLINYEKLQTYAKSLKKLKLLEKILQGVI